MAATSPEPSSYTETERKFEVVASTVTPSFEGLSSIARVERSPSQQLDAVYFDTPRRDLARHRMTLRRRTGGPDAGWHLKMPAGPDARTEVRLPLEDHAADDTTTQSVVPERLRDVVLAIVRDSPLASVARISTSRSVELLYGPDGSAVAEFCDDQITASADAGGEQRWREWELELTVGGVPDTFDRLTHRLLDAGALPAEYGSKLARVLAASGFATDVPESSADPLHRAVAKQVGQLLDWDRAVRSDVYDSVHQMRVTTRRIRSLLQSSEGSFGITNDEWILEELRALAGVLGVARDAEVLAQRYEHALNDLPKANVCGPVRERLVEGAKRHYQNGWKRSLSAMGSPRYFRLLDTLEALAAAEPPVLPPGETPKQATIDGAYNRMRKATKAARAAADGTEADNAAQAEADNDEALHRIRKRAKQLRYTAAATGAKKVANRAKKIQTLLGEHHDSVVSRSHLVRQAGLAHAAGEDTFTYGLLYQQEGDLAQRCEDLLDDALKKLDKAVRRS
mgnify:CR=1 FL=1|jgi:CHAD domain-containing protein